VSQETFYINSGYPFLSEKGHQCLHDPLNNYIKYSDQTVM